MTATNELRRMLDERGVEYEVDDGKAVKVTRWKAYGEWVSFIEYDTGETRFCIDARRLTAAQAIAATLGVGTCRNEMPDQFAFRCSECGVGWYGIGRDPRPYPRFCPSCGRRIVEVDE